MSVATSQVVKVGGALRLTEVGYPGSLQVNWNDGDDIIGGVHDVPVEVVHELRVSVREGTADAPLAAPAPVVEQEVLSPGETAEVVAPAEQEAPIPVADASPAKRARKGK